MSDEDPSIQQDDVTGPARQDQTAMALASLGVAFAQTLQAHGIPHDALATLQTKCEVMFRLLERDGHHQAAAMFYTFLRVLRDPGLLRQDD
jgi:hypothetical protein